MKRTTALQNIVVLLFICGIAIGFSSCASIIKGSGPQAINIQSTPTDAHCDIYDFKTDLKLMDCHTPSITSLPKSKGYFQSAQYKVTCNKDGYDPQTAIIEGNVNGWYVLGNLAFGGLIGYLIVDPATGAMWSLDPETLHVNLEESINIKDKTDKVEKVVENKDKTQKNKKEEYWISEKQDKPSI